MASPYPRGDVPGVQIAQRRSLSVPAAEAWPWLVEPELMQVWLADAVVAEGELIRLERLAVDEGPRIETARVEWREPFRLVLLFRRLDPEWESETRLELTLRQEESDGCRLELFHEGFQRLAMSSCLTIWEEYRRRWREALDRLAAGLG